MRENVTAALAKQLPSALTKAEVTRTLADNIQSASFEVGEDVIYVANTAQSRNKVIVECTDGSVITLTIEVN